MNNQITRLPLHRLVAFRIRVRNALLDQPEMLAENFVMLDEM